MGDTLGIYGYDYYRDPVSINACRNFSLTCKHDVQPSIVIHGPLSQASAQFSADVNLSGIQT